MEVVGRLLCTPEEEFIGAKNLLSSVVSAPTALNLRQLSTQWSLKPKATRDSIAPAANPKGLLSQTRVNTSLQLFVGFMLCEMYNYYLDNNIVLRDEAIRLTTALFIDARTVAKDLFVAPDRISSGQKHVFPVWNDPIIPSYQTLCNIAVFAPNYLNQTLPSGGTNRNAEAQTFQSFIRWIVENETELKWCLNFLNEATSRRIPAAIPTAVAFKQLQTYRVRKHIMLCARSQIEINPLYHVIDLPNGVQTTRIH